MVGTPLSRQAQRLLLRLTAAAGILLFFALALRPALDQSPTNDEPVHLTRGLLLNQRADLSLQGGHTPLSHWLIGLLMRTEGGLPDVRELASWPANDRPTIAGDLLWRSDVDVGRLLFLGRLPIIWSALIVGAGMALWCLAIVRPADQPGRAAALATVMVLFATSSNLLASAALATTDMVATVTYFLTICAWWFYWQRPGWVRWLLTGVLLGLGLAAKLTGILLVPLVLILAYAYYRRGASLLRPALIGLALLPVAGLTLWIVYAFQVRPVPLANYWETWATVLNHVESGHTSFFLGQVSGSGWWSYFPVSLLIKTPLAVILLAAAALLGLLWARAWRLLAFLLFPVGAILAAAMTSRLNIGYRHVLPALPFVIVLIGAAVPLFWKRPAGRRAVGIGLAWAAAAALFVHPHHLAYFNELVGGPARGYRYLGDSNLDWGQDLKLLASYGREVGDDLRYSYNGVADVRAYGLWQPSLTTPEGEGAPGFAPANPAPGRYAISASHWQGILPDRDLFDWFQRREPDGMLGYSILLYDVAAALEGEWIASCASPAPLLPAAEAERLVGAGQTRHVTFDCQESWVFPAGGPGWYVLPRTEGGWWITPYLAGGALTQVYDHRATEMSPDYAVYYWAGGDPAQALGGSATTAGGAPAALPVAFGGTASLEAYAGSGPEWLTLWSVREATNRPLSVQAHLIAPDGSRRVDDGLGYTANQWQPGDRFVQRHGFGPDAPPGELETGLYDFTTGEPLAPPVRLLPSEPALSE
jgi:hypothetical protein